MTKKQRKALAVAGSDERMDAISAMGVWLQEHSAQFPQFQISQWECDEHSVPTLRRIMELWIGRAPTDLEWEAVSAVIDSFVATPKTFNQKLAESNARLLTRKTGQFHSTIRLPGRDEGICINLENLQYDKVTNTGISTGNRNRPADRPQSGRQKS